MSFDSRDLSFITAIEQPRLDRQLGANDKGTILHGEFSGYSNRYRRGRLLLNIDDSVQKATTEQLRLQSEAVDAPGEPRKETLAITRFRG